MYAIRSYYDPFHVLSAWLNGTKGCALPRVWAPSRITSYNVCYTKLLRIFALARARRDNRPEIGCTRRIQRSPGLRQRARLVRLEQHRVAQALRRGMPYALGVGYEQIIADDLDTSTNGLGELAPTLLVIFRQGVLDRNDGIALDPSYNFV